MPEIGKAYCYFPYVGVGYIVFFVPGVSLAYFHWRTVAQPALALLLDGYRGKPRGKLIQTRPPDKIF